MLDRAKYVNSVGEVVNFGENGLFINHNDLRDYKWNYTEDNGIITSLQRGVTQKILPVIVKCVNEAEGIQIKNEIFEIFEKDVVGKVMGQMIINDYYLSCYVIESRKSNYLYNNGYLHLEIKLLTDKSYWCRECEKIFYLQAKEVEFVEENEKVDDVINNSLPTQFFPFDFPFDFKQIIKGGVGKKPMFGFPFDFKKNFNLLKFLNEHYTECEFKLHIFGACLNPVIFINSHVYEVKTTLSDGDYLVIDSRERTITKVGNNGNTINCFNNRNKQSDIFKKIAVGHVTIRWSATFTFKLTIIQERSEPPWR